MANESSHPHENTYTNAKFNINGNLAQQCQGHWPKILAALSPSLHPALEKMASGLPAGQTHVKCPVHGGKDGFRIFQDAAKNESGFISGGAICNTCGNFRNGFQLLEWLDKSEKVVRPPNYKPLSKKRKQNVDDSWREETTEEYRKREIYYLVGLYMKHGSALFPHVTYIPEEGDAKNQEEELKKQQKKFEYRLKIGQQYWASGVTDHDYIIKYFMHRGFVESDIQANMPQFTRLVLQVPFYHEDNLTVTYHPTIVNPIMKDVIKDDGRIENKIVSMNQIFLDLYDDGSVRKASVLGAVKKVFKWSDYRGGACRLYPLSENDDTLVIAEGIETSVAVRILTGLPVWASLTAGNLASFIPPKNIKTLIVAMDYDLKGAGQFSFEKLKQRLAEERPDINLIGVSPERYFVPREGAKGIDWDDVYTNEKLRAQAVHQWKEFASHSIQLPMDE